MISAEFPTAPFLHSELSDLIRRALELEVDIAAELGRPALDEASLQALNERKDDMAVILPSEARLAAVDSKVIFLKAHGMATAAERLHMDVAESLATEGRKVAEKGDAAGCPLGDYLDLQVQKAVDSLERLLQTARAVIGSISGSVLSG